MSAVVADQSTLDTWKGHAQNSTENVGRIWTDKTVQTENITLSPSNVTVNKADGADFLVDLSALSSTSNTLTISSKPLDIVLVLDVSGSMDRQMDSDSVQYDEVYSDDLDTSQVYYFNERGTYYQVVYNDDRGSWGYEESSFFGTSWESVTPKSSASDWRNTQFYKVVDSRLDALKAAVDGFIDSTDKANQSASTDSKHRIALVKFAGTNTD